MAAKTIQPVALEREIRQSHAEAADTKSKTTIIDAAQWLAELKAHPELLCDLLAGVDLTETKKRFPDLRNETRASLPTPEAAYHLNRTQQTLRLWACLENGPLRPLRISGRLHWKTEDLRRLLHVVPA